MDNELEFDPKILLNLILDDELRGHISAKALEGRTQVSRSLARKLNQAICAHISITGFRPNKVHLATNAQLARKVSALIQEEEDLLEAVVDIWAETSSALRSKVDDFLSAETSLLGDSGRSPELPFNYWLKDDLKTASEDFKEQHPEFDSKEAALMLCWQTKRTPITEEILQQFLEQIAEAERAHNLKQLKGLLWETWLDQLQELDAQAAEWGATDEFIAEVRRIAAQKIEEAVVDWTKLEVALDNLHVEAETMLDYFNLSAGVRQWIAKNCDPDQIEQVAEGVVSFHNKLLAYQDLNSTSSANLQEAKEKRSRLETIENEAFALYENLNKDFTAGLQEGEVEGSETEQVMESAEKQPRETPGTEVSEEGSQEQTAGRTDQPKAQGIEPEPREEEPEEVEEQQKVELEQDKPQQELEEEISPPSRAELEEKVEKHPGKPRKDEGQEPIEEAGEETVHPKPRISLEVLTVQQAAQMLEESDTPEDWNSFMWSLISETDLAGAYWLGEAFKAQGQQDPVPLWLLQAIQGSFWISPNSDQFVGDLLEIVNSNPQPQGDHAIEMLGLAAALRPTLIAPYSGLLGWLKTPACCPELHPMVEAIEEFASYQITLRPEDVFGVSGADQRIASIDEVVECAKRWIGEAPSRRTKFKRASDVWRYLVGPKGELRQLIEQVAKDNRQALEEIGQQLEFWKDRTNVLDHIDTIDQELYELRGRQIVGVPREQLLRYIEESCQIVQLWHKLVYHEREIETRGNWIFEQIAQLRVRVQENLPTIVRSLNELTTPAQPASLRAASIQVQSALGLLLESLQIDSDSFESDTQVLNRWRWLTQNSDNLLVAMAHRLQLLPTLALGNDSFPTEVDLANLPVELRDSYLDDPTIEKAIKGWIEKQDYRFIASLLSAQSEFTDTSELHRKYSESLEGSRSALRQSIVETTNTIEQAVVDGIIAEERADLSAIVEGIEPGETLNVGSQYEVLKEVRTSLLQARQRRLAEIKKHWSELKAKLEASSLDQNTKTQITNVITSKLREADTRLVEEYLARLEGIIDFGGAVDRAWQLSPADRDDLVEFIKAAPRIESWLESRNNSLNQIAREILNGHANIDINFDEISTKRRKEASSAIQAWRRLKQQRGNTKYQPAHIAEILRYLGFSFDAGPSNLVRTEQSDGDWLHALASMSASGLAKPIPQYGTFTRGRYHVICLWERPGADTISARLRELRLKLDSVILLYLGRLTIRQRHELIRMSLEQELNLAVLDEVLLLFLAQERDVRLPIFLRCSLPFAAVNPYTPFQAGDVPSEMFYGRESMARELQRPQGSSLVFGGRQLGKSALLRHVEREFHNPARERYARVEDIKLLGDPLGGQGTDTIWRKIRDIFKDNSLISGRITTDKPEEIERYVREAMEQNIDRRVLLLFDEADNFLDADARENFRITERLRVLMLDTQRRFKVAFAGLHNVQRFQGVANQPLAHFGTPLCVGPLEPDAAYQLVRQPLEYLGYRFSDNTGPLRILSYTNYHPGLIQLFCQELINRMRMNPSQKHPPFHIKQKDIEAVYRQVHVRIRERFDWTLALDMRYQAIAWSLIEDQMENKDSYARSYPPGEILRLVRYWWPQGFGEISTEELRSFLDEMEGLGVLVRNTDGYYRLRSPNLVRLMGSEADIETQLLELLEKRPPAPFEADNHHAPLDEQVSRYSPLTYAQERSLNIKGYGVGLIFGSGALGWDYLESTIEKFVPTEDLAASGSLMEIPLNVFTAEDLSLWLDKHLRSYPDLDHIIAYYKPYRSSAEEIQGLVAGAIEYCRRHQSKRKVLQLLFLFDPDASWAWLTLQDALRKSLEDSCDAVVAPKRWNIVGIRQRLSQHGKIDSESVCQELLNATGGWPILLDALFDRLDSEQDPRPTAQTIYAELGQRDTPLREDFVSSLGLIENQLVKRTLDYILGLEEPRIPLEMISPDLIGDGDQLTRLELDQSLAYMQRLGLLQLTASEAEIEGIARRALRLK